MIPDWELRQPFALVLVALGVLLVVLRWVWQGRRDGVHASVATLFLDDPLPRSWRDRMAWLPDALGLVAVAVLGVALAEPVERVPLPDDVEGIDILLCLDTSSSMTALDLDETRTRLDVARDAAKRFVEARPDDRIGVVSFARYPDLRCPPTLDHEAVDDVLAELAPVDPDGSEDATGIGTAIARAASTLAATVRPTRVVILLTDGEENVASMESTDEIAPVHAAQLCEELGVRVYTIVAGDVSASGIDTTQVERVAARTGGMFFVARDASTIDNVYSLIDQLERAPTTTPRFGIEHRFATLATLAFLLFAASRVGAFVGGAKA